MSKLNDTTRKMARNTSPYASLWWHRIPRLKADTNAVEELVQLHHDRLKEAEKLLHVDGRTYAAKHIVSQVNALTVQINAITKQLGELS